MGRSHEGTRSTRVGLHSVNSDPRRLMRWGARYCKHPWSARAVVSSAASTLAMVVDPDDLLRAVAAGVDPGGSLAVADRLRVFVSSVMSGEDLRTERDAAIGAIGSMRLTIPWASSTAPQRRGLLRPSSYVRWRGATFSSWLYQGRIRTPCSERSKRPKLAASLSSPSSAALDKSSQRQNDSLSCAGSVIA